MHMRRDRPSQPEDQEQQVSTKCPDAFRHSQDRADQET
jgi:hypothetical protein